MTEFLSIDPGVNSTGWCAWDGPNMMAAGVILLPRRLQQWGVPRRVQEICRLMSSAIQKFAPPTWDVVVCEMPQNFGSDRGFAAQGAGTVLDLALAVGAWIEFARVRRANFKAAPVSNWKGNLPKKIVADRVKKRLPADQVGLLTEFNEKTSHDWDAAGIGLWHLGRF